MRSSNVLRSLLLVAGLLLGFPVLAVAGTVSVDGDALVFRAAPGEANDLYVADEDGRVILDDSAAITVASAPCDRLEFDPVGRVRCDVPAGGVRAELGDGDDVLRVGAPLPGGRTLTADGGPGADRMTGGATGDVLSGDEGNDDLKGGHGNDLLDGGPGNDRVLGEDEADVVRGGAGDDVVGGGGTAAHADVIDGGPGIDALDEYEYTGGTSAPASVTLDGVADDGRAGEGDQVTDVERIKLLVPAVLDASALPGPVELTVFNTTATGSRLVGTAGNDTLTGYSFDDVIVGGAGADLVFGGYGNDTITGGPGSDVVHGDSVTGSIAAYGNDVIDVRDGEMDDVTCGVGADRVVADANDVVAPDCETVERPVVKPDPDDHDPPAVKLKVTVPKRLTVAAVRKGKRLSVKVPAAGKVTLTLVRGTGKRAVSVASGSVSAATAGATVRVTLKVRKGQSKALRRGAYKLVATLKPKKGKAVTVSAKVTLR